MVRRLRRQRGRIRVRDPGSGTRDPESALGLPSRGLAKAGVRRSASAFGVTGDRIEARALMLPMTSCVGQFEGLCCNSFNPAAGRGKQELL